MEIVSQLQDILTGKIDYINNYNNYMYVIYNYIHWCGTASDARHCLMIL